MKKVILYILVVFSLLCSCSYNTLDPLDYREEENIENSTSGGTEEIMYVKLKISGNSDWGVYSNQSGYLKRVDISSYNYPDKSLLGNYTFIGDKSMDGYYYEKGEYLGTYYDFAFCKDEKAVSFEIPFYIGSDTMKVIYKSFDKQITYSSDIGFFPSKSSSDFICRRTGYEDFVIPLSKFDKGKHKNVALFTLKITLQDKQYNYTYKFDGFEPL